MFLNPRKALKDGWITGVEESDEINIPIDSLHKLDDSTCYLQKGIEIVSRVSKSIKAKKLFSVPPNVVDRKMWTLGRGVYSFSSNVYVEIPEGIIGYILTNASLENNGIFIKSGLYKEGFKGNLKGTLYVLGGNTYLEPGFTIGNFIIAKSEKIS